MQIQFRRMSKMQSPKNLWVVIAAGGTIETSLLPYHLVHLKSHLEIEVAVAISPAAQKFVTHTALRAITGKPVYYENQDFDPVTGRPMHLYYSEADVLVIYPASVRILVQCAIGEITCPVTRLFAFSPKDKVVILPFIHPRMDSQIYQEHIDKLSDLGCTVLTSQKEMQQSQSPWLCVEQEIAKRLAIKKVTSPSLVLQLDNFPSST